MMKLIRFVIVLLILASVAVAQDRLPPRVVRVVGTSEVKVVPDLAVISIGVEKQNASASLAKRAADDAARRILADLRANGIAEKDIQTTFLSLQPQFNYRKGMRISYFVASQTLSITLRDLAQLDAVVESLIKAGANQLDSIEYQTGDLRKYRDQARDLAVKAAREKAQALAHALGQEVGKAYSIEEVAESSNQYSTSLLSNTSYEYANKRPAGPATAVGEKKISASVVVSFDLN
ncbi:MAG TPA: SIMPL domain-containing protein [Candidatus Angelobacter sp.]|nr:SIMPL domain-containing protein [Candidatus Angelobacter sp.]